MALPKRKHSHSRTRKRRTHQIIEMPDLAVCPECGNLKLPHFVCPHCGYYKDTQVIEIKKKEKKGRK